MISKLFTSKPIKILTLFIIYFILLSQDTVIRINAITKSSSDIALCYERQEYRISYNNLTKLPPEKKEPFEPIERPIPRADGNFTVRSKVIQHNLVKNVTTISNIRSLGSLNVETSIQKASPFQGLLPYSVNPEVEPFPEDREKVADTNTYPWRTICKLFITAADGTEWIGSGSIIGSSDGYGYHVLTAGHVAYLPYHGGWAESIEIIPGLSGDYMPFYKAYVTSIRTYSGWIESQRVEDDWALLTLDRDIGAYTGWMGYQTLDWEDPVYTDIVNTAGYPGDLEDGFFQYMDTDYGYSASEFIHRFYLGAASGQSGSPVWTYSSDTGERYILSILAYGDPWTGTTMGTRINGDKYDSIVEWIAADTPPSNFANLIDDGQVYSGFSPSTVEPGFTNFSVWSSERNIGTAISGSYEIQYFLFSDETLPAIYPIGSVQVDSLSPFDFHDSMLTVIFPSDIPNGTYWIGWHIDSENSVSELIDNGEEDNFARAENKILVRPKAEFTLELSAGWNMVSLPVVPDDFSASFLLSDLPFYQLVTWSGKRYAPAIKFEQGKGYWLLVLEDTNLTIVGTTLNQVNLTLSQGLNMVGGPNEDVQASSVFSDFYQVITWTGAGYMYAPSFEPGKGYWVIVLSDTEIIL